MSPNNAPNSEMYAELEFKTRPSYVKFEELRGFL